MKYEEIKKKFERIQELEENLNSFKYANSLSYGISIVLPEMCKPKLEEFLEEYRTNLKAEIKKLKSELEFNRVITPLDILENNEHN